MIGSISSTAAKSYGTDTFKNYWTALCDVLIGIWGTTTVTLNSQCESCKCRITYGELCGRTTMTATGGETVFTFPYTPSTSEISVIKFFIKEDTQFVLKSAYIINSSEQTITLDAGEYLVEFSLIPRSF